MCTRVLYADGELVNTAIPPNVVTGRNMDWGGKTTYADLWTFPVGLKRVGLVGKVEGLDSYTPFKWTSKYGSVIVSGYKAGTSDGINTEGLVVNLQVLSSSEYPKQKPEEQLISIGAWPQYLLDTSATVKEAVEKMEELEKNNIRIVPFEFPDRPGMFTGLHLSISDANGDSAIFQYRENELKIYHSKEYTVMTNDPFYDEQLAINQYWKSRNKEGIVFLPGTNRAEDRFARASYYLSAVPRNVDARTAIAITFSLIRNASVPVGLINPTNPAQSSTIWSTVADHKNLVYFFANVHSPSVCWVNLKKLDFSEGSGARRIENIEEAVDLGGDITDQFKEAEPFEFTSEPPIVPQ